MKLSWIYPDGCLAEKCSGFPVGGSMDIGRKNSELFVNSELHR